MGIFDKIKNAIWGETEEPAGETVIAANSEAVIATAAPAGTARPGAPAPAAPAPTATPAPAATNVDVAANLDAAVKRSGQKLQWRTSIVDLMKALGMESSLAERKELAQELGYDGDMGDSAAMNMWLHKKVLQKLKENGGHLPPELQ